MGYLKLFSGAKRETQKQENVTKSSSLRLVAGMKNCRLGRKSARKAPEKIRTSNNNCWQRDYEKKMKTFVSSDTKLNFDLTFSCHLDFFGIFRQTKKWDIWRYNTLNAGYRCKIDGKRHERRGTGWLISTLCEYSLTRLKAIGVDIQSGKGK